MSTPATASFANNFPNFQNKPFSLVVNGDEQSLVNRLLALALPASTFGASPSATAAQNTIALNKALATGLPIKLGPGQYNYDGQLFMNTSDQWIFGAGRFSSNGTTLKGTYTGGPQIVVGNDTTLVEDVGFQDLLLFADASGAQTLQTRYVRNITFNRCRVVTDGFLLLGDDTLDAVTRNAYICQILNCEMNQVNGTKTFMDCRNFAGYFVWSNSHLDGAGNAGTAADGVHGFSTRNNVRLRVDTAFFSNGIIHRFDHNIDCVDGRMGNVFIDNMFLDEAKSGCIYIDSTADSSKGTAYVGAEGWQVFNVFLDCKNGPAIYIGHHRTDDDNPTGRLQFKNINISGAIQSTTPILIDGANIGNRLKQVSIDGIVGFITPSDANQDLVRLAGSSSALALQDIHVDDAQVEFVGTAGRSVVRVEGTSNQRIRLGCNLNAKNVTKVVDDQTGGRTLIEGFYVVLDSFDYGTISANSVTSAHTVAVPNAVLARNDAAFVSLISGGGSGTLSFKGRVSADGVVTIYVTNPTGIDVASGTTVLDVRVRPGDM